MTGTIPFRRVVSEVDSRAADLAESLELLSVSQQLGVIPRSTITDKEPRAEDLTNYKRCWPGDLVLNRMSAYQGALGLARQEGIVSPDYAVLRSGAALEPRFLAYMMKSQWFVGEMTARLRGIGSPGTGSVRTPRVNVEDIGTIELPLPPVEEQRRIADFLDDQVARIDSLMEEKSVQARSIQDRFHEVRDALLEGELAPGTASGPTGSAGWPMPALARVVGMKAGDFIPAESIESEGLYAVYGANGLRGFTDTYTHSGETVLVGRQGALCGNVHVVDGEFWVSEHALVVTPRLRLDKQWLAQLLTSMDLGQYSVSAAQPGISVDRIIGLRIPLPPLETQRAIARSCIDAEMAAGSAVEAIDASRRLLEERKRALITAAVTGEMDVTTAKPINMGRWVPGVGADVPPPAPTNAPSLGGI